MDNFAGDKIHPSAMGNEKIALAVNARVKSIMSMTFKALSVFYNLFNKLFGFVGNIFA